MQHPLLRILLALLIGVWSPMCCCQAKVLAGIACGHSQSNEAAADSCCQNCVGESVPRDGGLPDEHGELPPGDCHSCPSCQGTSAGAGLKAESKLTAVEQDWNVLAAIGPVVLHDLSRPVDAIVAHQPSWWDSPPYVRANRGAQRWYCVLTL